MTKPKYMALADFQWLWTNTLKPAIPSLITVASVATCQSIVDELT